MLYHHSDKSMGKPNALSQWLDYRNRIHNNENIILLKQELLAVCVLDGMSFQDKEKGLLTDI